MMISTTQLRSAVSGAFLAICLAASGAVAQGYESRDALRFGLFGHFERTNLHVDTTSTATPPAAATSTAVPISGLGGGASLGYDWVRHRTLYGIEGDFSVLVGQDTWLNPNGLASASVLYSQQHLATLRGRLGWYATPQLLLYGTAGFAAQSFAARTGTAVNPAFTERPTVIGGVIGIGTEVDWHLYAKLFAEYQYASFGHFANSIDTTTTASVSSHSHILRLGVKFAFGEEHWRNAGW